MSLTPVVVRIGRTLWEEARSLALRSSAIAGRLRILNMPYDRAAIIQVNQESHKDVRRSVRVPEAARSRLLLPLFVSLQHVSGSLFVHRQYLALLVLQRRTMGILTFAPESGRSSQTPGLGNNSPEKAPRMVLAKQMTQTRTIIAVSTSATTRKNADSSSAPSVIVAEATPPGKLHVSMLATSIVTDTANIPTGYKKAHQPMLNGNLIFKRRTDPTAKHIHGMAMAQMIRPIMMPIT